MDKARLFKTNEIVFAQEVLDGKYSSDDNFVDVEEDFRVCFVRKAKNDGKPYFRFYYSLEDYREMFPDKADRYEILLNQRHFQESKWHKEWKERFVSFCENEKAIKNTNTKRHKIADAFYQKTNTCLEFQHSFINYDFEERNKFYKELRINIVWLYDLTHLEAKPMSDGLYQILEDNRKGFFRIAEEFEKLDKCYVFIQARDGLIYQVTKLFRKEIDGHLKSTVRYFYPVSINTAEEFVENIKNNKYAEQIDVLEQTKYEYTDLFTLWKPGFKKMVVRSAESPIPYLICEDPQKKGEMETKKFFYPPAIIVRPIVQNNNKSTLGKAYMFSYEDAKKPIWLLLYAE